jgi:phosphinothricin acetyltransferase
VTVVRPGRREDVPALTDIYNHFVRSSHVTFDTEQLSVEQRLGWFSHYAEAGPHRLLVAADGDEVLGYATSGTFRPKAGYLRTVETTVYCHPDATGQGVGSDLYAALFDALDGSDLHRAYAGVALPNDASLALHARFGFRPVGTFTEVGRKFDRYWDVAWLERDLGSAP